MNERQQQILKLISGQQLVSVETLLDETSASPATIRRDLNMLESSGRIERFHGGARLSRKNQFELSFERRAQLKVKQKQHLASIAATFIKSGNSIILGAGTTTLYIARELAKQKKQVSIVTNNLFIAQEGSNYPSLKLNLLGGNLDYANMESIGPTALENLQKHVIDKAFIGINGLTAKHGGTSIYEQNAFLYRSMANIANEVFIVADNSKFKAKASYVAVPSHQITHLITDPQADKKELLAFKAQGTQVHGL